MPFIGKQPKVGAYQLIDSITTSATATYALTVDGSAYFPETARNLIVSLNGVTQAPESAYTVSGSNIVFDSALTTSDVIDYILVIGDAVDIGTPSDGTVGTSQLASNIDLSGKTLTFANDQISGDAIDGGTATLDGLTVDTSTLVVDSTNNRVGIGTTSPSEALDISGKAKIGNTKIGSDGSGGSFDMTFETYSGGFFERMRINSSGNVGIGKTPSGSYSLDVNGNVYAGTYTVGNGNSYKFLQNDGTEDNALYYSPSDELFVGRDNGAIKFRTGANIRTTIDSSGNLFVGKTTITTSVVGTAIAPSGTAYLTTNNYYAVSINRLNSTGTVSLIEFGINNGGAGSIRSSSGGTPSFASASDERLKERVTDHESELSNVMSLRPVRWDWKNEKLGSGEGFVAQELEQTSWADLVSEGDDGYKQVLGLGVVETRLIKAIQEQQTIIEDLQTRLSALEAN